MSEEERAREALAQAYHLETGRPIVDNYWRQRSLGTMAENDRYAVRAMLAFAAPLETAARTLIAKLDECAPHVSDAFLHLEMRCGPYEGPNYAVELAALRSALSQQPPVEKQEAVHGG
ncbi:hypothetical protein BH11PSE6_BH11PSE6_00120 [soil metagenome]